MTSDLADVFVDVCTQRAYLAEHQPQRCRNAQQVLANLKHIMAFARLAKTPVVSCVDVDAANRIGAEYVSVPPDLTPLERKVSFSLLPRHTLIQSDNSLAMSREIFGDHQQAIFTKVHRDPFTNPKLDRLLTELPAGRFVIFGVGIETSLRMLALGLLRRRRKVAVLFDACGYWNHQEADMALRQMSVKGCELLPARGYISTALARVSRRLGTRIRPTRSVA